MKFFLMICLLFAIAALCCHKKICKTSTQETQSEKNSGAHADDQTTEILLSSNSYVRLLESWHEAWTAGIASGYNSLEYFFKIKIETDKKIMFDSAWLDKKSFAVFISKQAPVVSGKPMEYGPGDIILLRVSDIQDGHAHLSPTNPPHSHPGEALIRFKTDGKLMYFSIDKIDKRYTPNQPKN